MDGKYLYRGPAYTQSLLSVVMIEVEKRGGDETEGIEWELNGSLVNQCFRNI